ncbi:hypothetical protein KR018_008211, partial [Drosophila ironensis]
ITYSIFKLQLAFVSQSNATKWEKFLGCYRQGTKAAASLIRESVPSLRNLLICIDFTPPTVTNTYLGRLKTIYEFLKRGAFDKSSCLLTPLKTAATILKPYVQEIDNLKCFDE